jgi:chromosome segregation protein
LLGHVTVVDSLEAVPHPLPEGAVCVTRSGSLIQANGLMEFWQAGPGAASPLARKHMLSAARDSLDDIETQIATHQEAIASLQNRDLETEEQVRKARAELEEARRSLAQREGENSLVGDEAATARQQLETVSWELDSLSTEGQEGEEEKRETTRKLQEVREQRERIAADVHAQTDELRNLEARHNELQGEVTEHRIRAAELRQGLVSLEHQQDFLQSRIGELGASKNGRSAGLESYQAGIAQLTDANVKAAAEITSLEEAVRDHSARAASLKRNREKQSAELEKMERELSARRESLEHLRARKAKLDIRETELKGQRQNVLDRVASEYRITVDDIVNEPEPEWDGGQPPSLETIETRAAELRTKLEAMGPVNLVAIEEYQELEERYAFLTAQEQDLVNSKKQLMDMIRKINRTTSEMFRTTSEQVNTNFNQTFKKLFNGGSAKLVLVDEEDVLDSGIEIIARPPGKRLQNVSLLSGGERTMTAVALLFAIYMIKPSPFCLLDELDAALDDSNIGRFVAILKDFLQQSQFVVITHNRQTIAAADSIYGVTMAMKGISDIVSMKFTDYTGKGMEKAVAVGSYQPEPAANAVD